jgi:hypothetical protein
LTLEMQARVAPSVNRLSARSAIATADIELARHTLAELHETPSLEDAGERVLARLRRFVVRVPQETDTSS